MERKGKKKPLGPPSRPCPLALMQRRLGLVLYPLALFPAVACPPVGCAGWGNEAGDGPRRPLRRCCCFGCRELGRLAVVGDACLCLMRRNGGGGGGG